MSVFFPYPGSKYQNKEAICTQLKTRMEQLGDAIFVDACVGAGNIALTLKPKHCIINDNNPALIAAYLHAKIDAQELIDTIHIIIKDLSMGNKTWDNLCDDYTTMFNVLDYSTDETIFHPTAFSLMLGATFLVLIYNAVHALIRYNKQTHVYRISPKKNMSVPSEKRILAVGNYLSVNNVTLYCMDVERLLAFCSPQHVVFYDPPYGISHCSYTNKEDFQYEKIYFDYKNKINIYTCSDKILSIPYITLTKSKRIEYFQ